MFDLSYFLSFSKVQVTVQKNPSILTLVVIDVFQMLDDGIIVFSSGMFSPVLTDWLIFNNKKWNWQKLGFLQQKGDKNNLCLKYYKQIWCNYEDGFQAGNTVKPVNKGHPNERQNMVVIEKWSLFRGYFVLFYQGRVIEVWPLFTGWSLFRGGL